MYVNARQIPNQGANPEKRFGHTITIINKDRAVLFGGAVGEGGYKITNDTFSFDSRTNRWSVLKPRNVDDTPLPRAAHAATAVQANQMVVFGGAQSHGNLVDNDLYLLKLSSNEAQGKWVLVPVEGQKPGARYGHVMVFFKPFIVVFGGNITNEPNNEAWCLSIEKSPFSWSKLEFKESPSPRVYHAATIWKSSNRGDMILVFGGRNEKNEALKDMWGLRRHNSGEWDWLRAPSGSEGSQPSERYQHSLVCSKNIAIVVGGRNNRETSLLPLDIYNLDSSQWVSLNGVNRFRHISWLSNNYLYTHGGFESTQPSTPTDLLNVVDLAETFASAPELLKNIELGSDQRLSANSNVAQPQREEDKGTFKGSQVNPYSINPNIMIAEIKEDRGVFNMIKIDQLTQEGQKILDNPHSEPANTHEDLIRLTANMFIKQLLKTLEFKPTQDAPFPFKLESIIVLCDTVIKILKNTPSLIHLRAGVKIFGSLHGQFGDLLRFFKNYGVPDDDYLFEKKSDIEAIDYLFLGNYVDRGTNSLEVICLLLALKIKFPDHIHLLRGSHEDRRININEGLFLECQNRLKEDPLAPGSVYNKLNDVFEYLSYAAVIANKIFCVHSGIGTNLRRLEQIERIKKPFVLNHDDPSSNEQRIAFDMLWSDPVLDASDTQNKANLHRENLAKGTIVRFGTERIDQFLQENGLQIIVRSHEPVLDGAEVFGNSLLYTVFSCTDYCGITSNDAAIFHDHKHSKQLLTYTIKYVKSLTKWYNPSQMRKSLNVGREKEDPKERPVTPVRRITKNP